MLNSLLYAFCQTTNRGLNIVKIKLIKILKSKEGLGVLFFQMSFICEDKKL